MLFHLDGSLFGPDFATDELRDVFDQDGFVAAFQAVEAALARAEAEVGLIPASAVERITETADLSHVDDDRLGERVAEMGLLIMAIIETWQEAIGDVREYIHCGATSQDVSDTVVVLQLRAAHEPFRRDLTTIRDELVDIAAEHRDTSMISRTHHIHATPITFGLKTASWLEEVDRHLDRLAELEERVFALQSFGATGALGSLDDDGPVVQRELAEELDLALPNVAWFAGQDRFVEYLDTLVEAATTLERIAQQVLILNRPEIGELGEPARAGEIGSSTMPHKLNPVKCERAVALARLVRGQAGVMTDAMAGYNEQDFGAWHVDFAVILEACCYFGRRLQNVLTMLEELEVHPDRMLENLDIHGGLVASEAVMMVLVEHVGRQTVHDVVHEAAMTAQRGDRSFLDCLAADDRVTDHLDAEQLAALTGTARTSATRAGSSTRRSNGRERPTDTTRTTRPGADRPTGA